ncbi:hypothetical protein chiPu_0027208, partial [Chiloscyllium punctatum]|nr:hypothetical protein [Chiloscyllium punctatum]
RRRAVGRKEVIIVFRVVCSVCSIAGRGSRAVGKVSRVDCNRTFNTLFETSYRAPGILNEDRKNALIEGGGSG